METEFSTAPNMSMETAAILRRIAPEGPGTQGQIRLNAEQNGAIDKILDFIADPAPKQWYFTLKGFAGTGKTFCLREVLARTKTSKVNLAFTAPTNKAAKELRKVTGTACTIYSLLGLRIDKSGELKQLVSGKKPDLSDIDVILIDEGYMINQNLFNILEYECQSSGLKVIFIGDPAQLPPVGEAESPVERGNLGAMLTQVMRHDNQILEFATYVRKQLDSIAPSIIIKSSHDEYGGVWKMNKHDFKQSIFNAAANGGFADGQVSKVLAWRNVTVEAYNNLIRSAIFGAEGLPGSYHAGDRIVAAGPCERGDEVLLTTDDEAIVESVLVCKHPLEPKYQAFELKCINEIGKVVRLLVLHPASKMQFENDSAMKAHQAKANPKLWKNFWTHKELFHEIKYAYALTVHRSQGSTYRRVWVDYQDILFNRNRKEAFQCLYTASTRPTTELYLA